jgi:hypothetical protein
MSWFSVIKNEEMHFYLGELCFQYQDINSKRKKNDCRMIREKNTCMLSSVKGMAVVDFKEPTRSIIFSNS